MSTQPSQFEQVRTTAAEAIHTVAETVDPTPEKEAAGWRTKNSLKQERANNPDADKKSYKEQLNDAARGGSDSIRNNESIVSKAISYIPGGSALEKSIYGASDADMAATKGEVKDDGSPPTRPQNDVQVEEFLKSQYKSKSGSRMPELGEDVDKP